MTNFITITNMLWMVTTGTIPVSIQSYNESQYFNESSYMFISGFTDAFPLAILLATVWAILASLRRNIFPSSRD